MVDDLAEAGQLVSVLEDCETFIFRSTWTSADATIDAETGKCVECAWAATPDGNNVVIKCAGCGTVSYDYNIDKSAVSAFVNGPSMVSWGSTSPQYERVAMTEEGSPEFMRYQELEGLAWGTQHGFGFPSSKGQYLIIKIRVGENKNNQTYVQCYIPSKTSASGNGSAWASAGVAFKVSEDNEWHTIVIDLAARSGAFAANDDGSYSVGEFHTRFYGDAVGAWNPGDYVDIAYMAVAESFDDVSKFIGDETYEWSVSAAESIIRNTATHEPVVAE